MTTVALASVKGAPGVTTLACLVAAAWPEERRVVLVECDPSGGDLAARFRLSAHRGWASFGAASRRGDGTEPIGPHVQTLPGGLAVLVGARCADRVDDRRAVTSLTRSAGSQVDGHWDVVADLGRLLPGERGAESWIEHSTALLIVLRRDAPSILRVRERAVALRRRRRGTTGLVVVGSGSFRDREIERFTDLPVVAVLPDDLDAARIAGGAPGGSRRLSRHLLVESAGRLASRLSAVPMRWPGAGDDLVEAAREPDTGAEGLSPPDGAPGGEIGQTPARPDAPGSAKDRQAEAGVGTAAR